MTRERKEALAAFCVAAVLFWLLHAYYDVTQFLFDARDYWDQAMLQGPGPRGYLYPLLLFPARLGYFLVPSDYAFQPWRVMSSLAWAAVLALAVPPLFTQLFGGKLTLVRRLLPCLLMAALFPGALVFPMSDLPAFVFCWAGVALALRPPAGVSLRSLAPALAAGVLMGAAYNTRSIYLYPLILLAAAAAWPGWPGARRAARAAAFAAGFVLVSLPQAVINHGEYGRLSINPSPGLRLFSFQLHAGLLVQRYETRQDPNGRTAGVVYVDAAGQRLLQKPEVDEGDGSLENYLSIAARYPLDVLGIYARHAVNGLDLRDGRLYITRASASRNGISLLGFALVALAAWTLFAAASRKSPEPGVPPASPSWRLALAVLLLPVAAITPGAVETRFYLPLHLLAWCTVAFRAEPAALAASLRRHWIAIPVALAAALGLFAAVTLTTMSV